MLGSVREHAALLLADGTRFDGVPFGARGVSVGEVCFNTSMTGYQEILTDPSYAGQIITMTYPEMGNYGVNPADVESRHVHATGLVIRESSPVPSSWRATATLEDWLRSQGVVGIRGVDTRELTRHLRTHGAQMGVVVSDLGDEPAALHALGAAPGMEGANLAERVTCAEAYPFTGGPPEGMASVPTTFRVVAYDFGVKEAILRHLKAIGAEVFVVPASMPASKVLALRPDGVFLSNGPGDPAAVTGAIDAVRQLVGKVPMFGICLGHQIMALALGGRTYKLKFGHRGANHPVLDVTSGKVEITAQNHGFAVDEASLPDGARVTHVNLNDRTVEGFEHAALSLYSVQYHPEASPGPHDAHPHFRRFAELMNLRGRPRS